MTTQPQKQNMDTIETIILKDVKVQCNGIIRNSKGRLIARLVPDIDFSGEHVFGMRDIDPPTPKTDEEMPQRGIQVRLSDMIEIKEIKKIVEGCFKKRIAELREEIKKEGLEYSDHTATRMYEVKKNRDDVLKAISK